MQLKMFVWIPKIQDKRYVDHAGLAGPFMWFHLLASVGYTRVISAGLADCILSRALSGQD